MKAQELLMNILMVLAPTDEQGNISKCSGLGLEEALVPSSTSKTASAQVARGSPRCVGSVSIYRKRG